MGIFESILDIFVSNEEDEWKKNSCVECGKSVNSCRCGGAPKEPDYLRERNQPGGGFGGGGAK